MRSPLTAPALPPDEEVPYTPEIPARPPIGKASAIQSLLRNKWLKFLLRLTCTVLLFAFLFRSISWSGVIAGLHHLDTGQILIAIIVGLFGVAVSTYQWQSLLDAENIRMDLRRLINLYLVGIAFNHFLPTGMGGDVVKAFYVNKEGKNVAGSTSAVVMSRVTGFMGMLLVSIPSLLIWHALFTHTLTVVFLLSCLGMCVALAMILGAVMLLPHVAQGRWGQVRFLHSLFDVGRTFQKSIARPRPMLASTIFGMLFHISAALNYYTIGILLHVNVPFTFYLVAIPFVSLIAFLPIAINGFGLRETAFVFIFSTLHVLPATATLMALLMDAQILLFGIIGGCIYLLMGGKKEHPASASTSEVTQKLSV